MLRDLIQEIWWKGDMWRRTEGKKGLKPTEEINALEALFNSNLKEQREEAYKKGQLDAFNEFTANELRRYQKIKQREHRAKLATNTLEVKEI